MIASFRRSDFEQPQRSALLKVLDSEQNRELREGGDTVQNDIGHVLLESVPALDLEPSR